jgi:dienelactone hydrolase
MTEAPDPGGHLRRLLYIPFIATLLAPALLILAPGCSGTPDEGVVGKEVTYSHNGTTLKGYLAYDASSNTKRPGVLVVHEWWGHNEYARERARQLAGLGYVALAVDMYGDGRQASHPADAGKFASEVMSNMEVMQGRMLAAKEYLLSVDVTNPQKIAAIGYCFGGGVVLNAARMGMNLRGVVSFHGSLGTASPAQYGTVIAKVLVLNGADDPLTSPEQIDAFKKEMSDAGVDYTFISYPGAVHAFTNPEADSLGKKFSLPLAYNKEADQQSWEQMKQFLQKIFQ